MDDMEGRINLNNQAIIGGEIECMKVFAGFVRDQSQRAKNSVGIVSYIKLTVYNMMKKTTNEYVYCRECKEKKTKHQMANIWICSKCWNRSLKRRNNNGQQLDKDGSITIGNRTSR